MSNPITEDRPAEPRSPFLLTKAGTWITLACVFSLYLSIVLVTPFFAMVFGGMADQCAGGDGLVCTAAGEGIARLSPVTGATAGFLVALFGSFLPVLRSRRLLWLLSGYGLAVVGVVLGFAVAATA